jgi:adenosylcobinamide-GDP ribazoletransferase
LRAGAAEDAPPATGPRRIAADAALAVAFLTVVPVRARHGTLDRAAAWFPLVGALIGAFAGAVRVATEPLVGPAAGTVLALIALVAITGALHQDGLADTADGLGARGGPERRLTVMRDSAVGVFGALALILWALLVVAALEQLPPREAAAALVAAAAIGRWSALLHAAGAPPARPEGLGAHFHPRGAALAVATVAAAAVAAATSGVVAGAVALAAGAAVAAASALFARRTLGGRTGDTIGAAVALAEVAVCVVMAAAWNA